MGRLLALLAARIVGLAGRLWRGIWNSLLAVFFFQFGILFVGVTDRLATFSDLATF
jgi:hypothetical protein